MRVFVARGSMPYSAVTQPLPVLRRNGGTRSSTLAVQITFVRPTSIRTEPSAWARKPGVMVVGRGSEGARPSLRIMYYPIKALGERMPQVDMTCECVDFLAAHENLHALDRRQVHGEGVDDRIDREDLVQRSAGMLRRDLRRQVDECVAAFGDEDVAQQDAGGDRGHLGGGGRELGLDDRARLFRRAGPEGD